MNIEDRCFHRQTLVFGEQTQAKVRSLRVYVCGLTLLGLEITKNLVMMGVGKVIVFDNTFVKQEDAINSFYFSLDDVGLRKAKASLRKLNDLSTFTEIVAATTNDILQISSEVDIAVVSDCWDSSFSHSLNQEMHSKNKGFILASNLALYGSIFVDFGDKHEVSDCTGQQIEKRHIKMITNERQAQIQLADGDKQLQIGEQVFIYRVKGMKEINGKVYRVVGKREVYYGKAYRIDVDSTDYSPYRSGGIAQPYRKKGDTMQFDTLAKSLQNAANDLAHGQESSEQILVFQPRTKIRLMDYAIMKTFSYFYRLRQALPDLQGPEQGKQLRQLINKILQEFPLSQQEMISMAKSIIRLSRYSRVQISPFATLFGGIAAQQVVKFTGKYTPIRQWLHYDEMDMIEESGEQTSKYNLLFGKEFQEKCERMKIALVGAGALGSQLMKMFSEIGVGSKTGLITIVDDDTLSEENLNRMCLATKQDICKSKSELLADRSKNINKSMNLQCVNQKIISKTENLPHLAWKEQGMIVSVVDTFSARNVLDALSTKYKKILLNGGSQDLKCSTQIVLPYLSQPYQSLSDVEGEFMPFVKAHQVPYKINRVIQLAYDKLCILLDISEDLYNLTIDKEKFIEKKIHYYDRSQSGQVYSQFQRYLALFEIQRSRSYKACVQLAVTEFYSQFQEMTQTTLKNLPEDYIASNTGMYYWSGLRSMPKVIHLDLKDPIHVQFVQSLANVYAEMLGIEPENEMATINLARQIYQSQWQAKRQAKLTQHQSQQISKVNTGLSEKMLSSQFNTKSRLSFDHNHPRKSHFDYIHSLTLLHARKYQIEEVSKSLIEKFACKIAPTIITGISVTAGVLGLQLIKIMKGDQLTCKNSYINLALPRIVQSKLAAPKLIKDTAFNPIMMGGIKCIPESFSSWESLSIVGPMTVSQLKQLCEERLKIRVDAIFSGINLVFGLNIRITQQTENLEVSQAIRKIKKGSNVQNPVQIFLSGECQDEGVELSLPQIYYYLPN